MKPACMITAMLMIFFLSSHAADKDDPPQFDLDTVKMIEIDGKARTLQEYGKEKVTELPHLVIDDEYEKSNTIFGFTNRDALDKWMEEKYPDRV